MRNTVDLVKVGDDVEYYSPTNERWLDKSMVSAVNDDGTYQIEVTKNVRRVENKPSVRNGNSPIGTSPRRSVAIGSNKYLIKSGRNSTI